MTDAPSGSTAPAKKGVGKAKAGAAAESGADGKKRFEVKKVRGLRHFDAKLRAECTDNEPVECSGSVGLGHRSRQLCYLQKPHHGSMSVPPSQT